MLTIEQYLKKQSQLIDKALDKCLPHIKSSPADVIYKAMRYSVLNGGKRIRPILTLACAKAGGGTEARAMEVACAVELVHAYSLVHDDLPCMDNDDYRRDRLTCHRKFGEADALLAGSALLTHAFTLLSKRSPTKPNMRLIQVLSEAAGVAGMIGGQAVDKQFEKKNPDQATMDYITIHKTGKLLTASCHVGALAAGASPSLIRRLVRYGEYLGFAFQVVDDIMDNDGYLRFINREEAYEKAAHLIEKAQKEVKPLGQRAMWLNKIAHFVLTRNR